MSKYTKNPTWADGSGGGTPITAAKLNNVEAGIFDAHYQAAARVYHNASQSISNSTPTALAFNSERFDTESNASSTIHDTASNNSRLTCRTAGKYLIIGNVEWAANGTGLRRLEISCSAGGGVFIAATEMPGTSTGTNKQIVSTIYDLAVNDYVELYVTQTSGGPLNVNASTNYSPEFMMVCVG